MTATVARACGEALAATIRRLFSDMSIELAASAPEAVAAASRLLDPGTRVFLVHLPRGEEAERVAAARRLAAAGLVPVPHVAARRIGSRAELAAGLAAFREAGVRELLLVAGDGEPRGPFPDSLAVLESGLVEESGITRLFVAGHPEGHPRVDAAALEAALAAKAAWSRSTGIPLEVVSQFVFDAAPLLAFARRLSGLVPGVPLRAGLPGPAGVATLLRFARLCGVGASMRALVGGGAGRMARLAGGWDPGALVLGLARGLAAEPELPLAAVHFYTFGGFERTARWAQAVRAGRFRIEDGELAVEVA